ncbi:vacuolar protein sorting-associated protein 33A-like [Schistocerca gregaria]|uniref:vacuolar protein sorting-associated protein 33A-like n=1 Tax=Schistocerca gregaria TaxID=7010 RepID=UPI00211E4107|nr:vacuolar protein sorting-associated protein 33A-like [Schistocerca gregaria]
MDKAAPSKDSKKLEVDGHCDLSDAPVNLEALRDKNRAALRDIFRKIDSGTGESKAFILEQELVGLLGQIVEVDFLKNQGIEKFFFLSGEGLEIPSELSCVVFFIRFDLRNVRVLAKQVKMLRARNRSLWVIAIPRLPFVCERVLEEEQVIEDIQVLGLELYLIPYESDVLSMQVCTSYRDWMVEGDPSILYDVASGLMKLQMQCGIIPHIKGKGVASRQVANMLVQMRYQMPPEAFFRDLPEITQLVLLDRVVDPVTPLLTMLTYEGLIDEFFGIHDGCVKLSSEMVLTEQQIKTQTQQGVELPKKIKIMLNNQDAIFSEIRDLNFSRVGKLLSQKAKLIDEYYKKRHSSQTTHSLKSYVQQFSDYQKKHKYLHVHTNMVEKLLTWIRDSKFHAQLEAEQNLLAKDGNSELSISYLEDCICQREPLPRILRLLCLLSLCTGGLKEKTYNFFVKEIIQTYGIEHLFTLNNLGKMGLLCKYGETKPANWFSNARQMFNLIITDPDEQEPPDMASIYSGYSPLSAKIVMKACSDLDEKSASEDGLPDCGNDVITENWKSAKNNFIQNMPGGPTFCLNQKLDPSTMLAISERKQQEDRPHTVFVFFIGGITFAEISALRWIKKHRKINMIIGTTNFVNGNTLIECSFEKI